MARAPTTADAFAAIAEPRRRELLGALAGTGSEGGKGGERDVSWLVSQLGWPQPQVSKHLSVLREVGLVSVVRKGRRRMYSLNGEELRPVYEWVKSYERFWEHKLQRIKDRAEQMARESILKERPQSPSSST
ncbi:MAG TPA: metalloregulator ArsR/SmtB family transcription factor [Phycisphaerales bacterium]|nr:metalloregulator ArsR/SmtB family transcription factor [Phycisphaerales bacterium]